LISKGSKHSI